MKVEVEDQFSSTASCDLKVRLVACAADYLRSDFNVEHTEG